ncbi:MAG: prealbumin-like fold domain-containing protein [Blautia massiliensis (ex Durand et al. 2017)]
MFGPEYANGASDKYGKRASLTEEQKEEEHTLTVLYLERGAGLSNCKMNFTLPYAEVSSVTTTDLAKLTFTKVKKDEKTPLPGAVFKLYTDDTCTTELKTATSGADGKVTFDKLFPGTYYMKEVQAPNGYVASNEVWTVDVTEGNETATLKDSSNNTVTSIVNETPEEIINSSMVTSKTAKVKDWDQRTYDITINATSTSTSSIIETKTSVADIMLVLDVSGSMGEEITSYSV